MDEFAYHYTIYNGKSRPGSGIAVCDLKVSGVIFVGFNGKEKIIECAINLTKHNCNQYHLLGVMSCI